MTLPLAVSTLASRNKWSINDVTDMNIWDEAPDSNVSQLNLKLLFIFTGCWRLDERFVNV